jgi:hypothetical protein
VAEHLIDLDGRLELLPCLGMVLVVSQALTEAAPGQRLAGQVTPLHVDSKRMPLQPTGFHQIALEPQVRSERTAGVGFSERVTRIGEQAHGMVELSGGKLGEGLLVSVVSQAGDLAQIEKAERLQPSKSLLLSDRQASPEVGLGELQPAGKAVAETATSQQAALEVRVCMAAQTEGGSQLPDGPLQVAGLVSNLRLKVSYSGGGAGGYPAQQRAGQSNVAAGVLAALEGYLG